jgi:hypothetical protein
MKWFDPIGVGKRFPSIKCKGGPVDASSCPRWVVCHERSRSKRSRLYERRRTLRVRHSGADPKPLQAPAAKSRGGERCSQVRAGSPDGNVERGESCTERERWQGKRRKRLQPRGHCSHGCLPPRWSMSGEVQAGYRCDATPLMYQRHSQPMHLSENKLEFRGKKSKARQY